MPRLQLQPLPVLLKTLSFPSILPVSSLLANSLARADIFTTCRKLYVSATILKSRGSQPPLSDHDKSSHLKLIKLRADRPGETDAHPICQPEGALRKMGKVCLRIENIRIRIFKGWVGREERNAEAIRLPRPPPKPDLGMEWLTFGAVRGELLQAVFIQNV